jgi:IPT/TIG domain
VDARFVDNGLVDAGPPTQGIHPPARPDRWLVGSVAVLAVLVVIAAVALAVSLSGGTGQPSPTVAAPTQPGTPTSHPSSTGAGKSGTGKSGAGGSTSSSTTTSTVVAAPGGPPVISSLSPSSGTAGQGIQVAGANFLSTSGQIVATFNGQVAPTSCPAQNTCTITVPPSTSPSAQVVITTASGTSNAVTFTYS